MFRKVVSVHPVGETKLLAFYGPSEVVLYDMAPLIDGVEVFAPLGRDPELFRSVKVDAGGYGISWSDEIDLSADELYAHGQKIEVVAQETERVVDEVAEARRAACVSQKQLGEASGIKQPVIARLERGGAMPRLDTLIKVLAPLGKTLKVVDLEPREAI